ncbi:MAG: NAD(P)H-dependent oxidoreductase, partial [Phenylobacterium sp.]
MKHALIIAHPNAESLTRAVAKTYADSVRALGHEVVVRDLYRIGFDPCLKADEIAAAAGFVTHADVKAERTQLADADVFALFYPLWFNAPPAILKGHVDRVFGPGFGYEPDAHGALPLLEGRRLISFTTSGAPDHWVRETGALQALITLLDKHLSAMCGLQMVDHVHTGGIVSNLSEAAFEA